MIKSIQLKFGRAPNLPPERIGVTPVTVFVGPNNSGKSRVLSEIDQLCRSGNRSSTAVVLDDLEFQGLDATEVADAIAHITLTPNPGEAVSVDNVLVGAGGTRQQVPRDGLFEYVQNPSAHLAAFCQWFLAYSTLMLV